MANSEGLIELEGKIVAVLPGTMFRIELPNKHVVLGHISGKLRKNFIKIFVGDTVRVEMDPKDITQARITYRLRSSAPKPLGAVPAASRPAPRRR